MEKRGKISFLSDKQFKGRLEISDWPVIKRLRVDFIKMVDKTTGKVNAENVIHKSIGIFHIDIK